MPQIAGRRMGRNRRRALALLGAGGVALVVAGCGQTDFATGVGQTQATLNGTITTIEAGAPERAWFQYWPAATPQAKQRTAGRRITATGPISATVTGLTPDTTYAFRLCGKQGTVRACAQTRTFITSRDFVRAVGASEPVHTTGVITQVYDLDVDVTSGLPTSRAALVLDLLTSSGRLSFNLGSKTDPDITCLAVSGNAATIGFTNAAGAPPGQPFLGYGFASFVDGGPAGSGRDLVAATFGTRLTDPSVCPLPTDPSSMLPLASGDVVVNDASAIP